MEEVGVDYETTPVGFFEKSVKLKKQFGFKGHPRFAVPTHLAIASADSAYVVLDPKVEDFPELKHTVMFNAVFDLLVIQSQRHSEDFTKLYSQSFDDVLAMLRVLGVK